jgi:hypothetical protein
MALLPMKLSQFHPWPLLPWVCEKVIEFCPLLPFCHKIYDTHFTGVATAWLLVLKSFFTVASLFLP